MAGRRNYGGSSMAALLQNEGIPPETVEALLGSSSSSNGFRGTSSIVNFEDACRSTPQRPFYRTLDLGKTGDDDFDECLHQPEKKKRLADDQVQFLEKSFETENKLDPERTLQLARHLGLQPRQIAIWFQNRRARWKTKQLEKDYEALMNSYNSVKAHYEVLLKEKEKLKAEVASLMDQLLEERKIDNSEKLEIDMFPSCVLQNPISKSKSAALRQETSVYIFKQEDLSSANSTIVDSNSPPHAGMELQREPAESPNAFKLESPKAFKLDKSDLSYAEDYIGVRECRFLKLEDDDNTGSYNFSVDDQTFWFWHY